MAGLAFLCGGFGDDRRPARLAVALPAGSQTIVDTGIAGNHVECRRLPDGRPEAVPACANAPAASDRQAADRSLELRRSPAGMTQRSP